MTDRRKRLLAVAIPVLVTAGLSAYLVSFHGWLFGVHGYSGTGYDDGVYAAAVSSFAHGVLPYRDFVWVEPPGTVVTLAPLGLLGRWIGTEDMLAVGRVLTIVLAAANAGLAAWVLRSRGWLAMVIAGLGLACFPLAPVADHTMNMEPYFVFFVLLAAVAAFNDEGNLASTGRLVLAGLLLGLATGFKVWAIALLVALAICCLPRIRLAAAAVIGWLVMTLALSAPFLIVAPRAFWHQAVTAQLHRSQSHGNLPVRERLGMIFGLDNQHTSAAHTTGAVVATITLAVLLVAVLLHRRRVLSRVELFAVVGTFMLAFGLLHASQFYDHYTYATAALLVLVIGVLISRLSEYDVGSARIRVAVSGVAVLAVLGGVAVPKSLSQTRTVMSGAAAPNPAIAADLPAGSCAVSVDPVVLIEANRWDPSAHCNPIVDPFGLWIEYEETAPPGYRPYPGGLLAQWSRAFDQADGVVLQDDDRSLPVDPGLRARLAADFEQLSTDPRGLLYADRTTTSGRHHP